MRILFLALLLATLVAAQDPETAPRESSEAEAAAEETVITPFGPARKAEPKPEPAPAPKPTKPLVDVKVEGEVATFTRQTPFGPQSWQRNMSELSAAEKEMLEDSRKATAKAQPAVLEPASAAKKAEPKS